jgi:hypothetical protein
MLQLRHWNPYFHLIRTFDLAPLQGASRWLVSSQG